MYHHYPPKQVKVTFVWYLKQRADPKILHDENNVLTDDELLIVRDFLKISKLACLWVQNEHFLGLKVLSHTQNNYRKTTKIISERS